MKLLRYGPKGKEKPGMLDAEGNIRDLSNFIPDIDAAAISPGGLKSIRRLDPASLPLVSSRVRLAAPIAKSGKVVAIGLNYQAHVREGGWEQPKEPVVFLKATSAISGPNDAIQLPIDSHKVDWEVELAMVVGRTASRVPVSQALSHIAGYCIGHDVSERAFQFERGPTWDKGKSCDSFCPLGPWLVSSDEVGDPQNLDLWLSVNGIMMQSDNTRGMIFSCAEIVAYVSRFMTLWPGDVILTGTPMGSGFARTPPHFLTSGDRVLLGITGLGEQRQRVRGYD